FPPHGLTPRSGGEIADHVPTAGGSCQGRRAATGLSRVTGTAFGGRRRGLDRADLGRPKAFQAQRDGAAETVETGRLEQAVDRTDLKARPGQHDVLVAGEDDDAESRVRGPDSPEHFKPVEVGKAEVE